MLCQISGVFVTPNGEIQPNVTVKMTRAARVHSYMDAQAVVVIPDTVSFLTDVNGVGTVDLYPGRYQVELLGSDQKSYRFAVNVPALASVTFQALLTMAPDATIGAEQLETVAGYAASASEDRVLAQEAAAYVLSQEATFTAAAAAGVSVPPLAEQAAIDTARPVDNRSARLIAGWAPRQRARYWAR